MTTHTIDFDHALAQTETWSNAAGQTFRLAEMETGYLRNVAGFLVSRRHIIKARAHIARFAPNWVDPFMDEGDIWLTGLEEEDFRAKSAQDYLRSTPLWKALMAELARRGEKDLAFVVLDDSATDASKRAIAEWRIAAAQNETFRLLQRNARALEALHCCEHGIPMSEGCFVCMEPEVPSGGPSTDW